MLDWKIPQSYCALRNFLIFSRNYLNICENFTFFAQGFWLDMRLYIKRAFSAFGMVNDAKRLPASQVKYLNWIDN